MKRKTAFVDRCPNLCGKLQADCRQRLINVIGNPTHKTWDDAHGIIIPGQMTLWQAVIAVRPGFPRQGPVEDTNGRRVSSWPQIPDQLTLYRAIRFAITQQAA